MADGMTPAAEAAGTLYERDFHLWTQAQAAALRAAAGRDPTLDTENIAEEIESLGRRERHDVEARVATIIEHLVKLEFSPATEPRPGWRRTVREARRAIERSLKDSPSLRRKALDAIGTDWLQAVQDGAAAMADHGEEVAQVAERAMEPYTAEQVLGDWWPEPPPPRP